MFMQGQVGPARGSDGGLGGLLRLGKDMEAMVSQLHGRFFEQTSRENMFRIQGAATTTTAGLATTFTGLAVGNPAGSGVNMVIDKAIVNQVAALTASTTIGLMGGAGAITASLTTIQNCKLGGRNSLMVASAGQTISTPVLLALMASSGSGAMTVPGILPGVAYDVDGSIIVPPGYFIASYTSAISTTALQFGLRWEEVPI